MLLVRMALMKRKPEDFGNRVGDVVYRTMLDTINLTAKNNFQIKREVVL